MRKIYFLSISLLLILGQGESLFAQFRCGLPSPTEQEKQASFAQYQTFLQQKSTQKQARVVSYKVAVKANILTATASATPALSESDIRAIIAHANTYLQNINVELYLYNNQVFPIVDDKYYDFKIADEVELRRKYDVQNAINIYFAKSITLKDLTILSGYAALPNTSASSNRIMFSYFDRTADDFENLKNKTFLHEIGHYFGLFHTFQDSNNPDISKRELVTRGAGSNCVSMGDQLCDTPADPFERLPLMYAFNCNQNAPADLQDTNGENFTPPVNNIMSYYQRCGDAFTEQQYQKMQASFAIRFSPLSEYQIATRSSNFVTVDALDKKVYCVGDSLKITLNLEGLFENNNQLFVEISDKFGRNYQKIESRFTGLLLLGVKLPYDLPEGDDYRLRITATRPETVSPVSENFAIRTFPTASITATNTTIYAGETTYLTVNLGGSGTWSYDLSDGTSIKNTRSSSYQIEKTLNETTTFSILSVKNVCGEGTKSNSVRVNVIQPQIQTEAFTTTTLCQGQSIKLGITILGTLSPDNQLVMQISDNSGSNYVDLPTQVSLFTLSAQIPSNFQVGTGYRLKVLAKKSQLFSSPIGPITVIAPPSAPKIASTFSYCQSRIATPLVADGTNLKWFLNEFDIKSSPSITPSTEKEGVSTYYVSQTNAFGCEGPKSKTTVTVRPLATAMISGDRTMVNGDSTLLNVNITGELPANFILSDGRSFMATSSPFILEVRPSKSTTYGLKEVTNSCGLGNVSGSAKITILEPLAGEEPLDNLVKIFPNPASEQLVVEFLAIPSSHTSISLSDLNGKILQQKSIKTVGKHQEVFDINHYSAGNYFMKLTIDKQSVIKKIVIE
jgi:predicted Zn-dependent protease with MMP-like domain